jgi:glutamate-ammonia-ligase adenylyltransferase
MVTSLEAFRHYQLHEAWVWEHQALTRARFAAGDREVGKRFEAIRADILRQARDPVQLAHDVAAMRERMHTTHPPRPEDVKYRRGGLVDVEFIVQYLILAHAAQHPALLDNKGNLALLGVAADNGLIDAQAAQAAQTAYRTLRSLQHQERLEQAPPSKEALLALDQVCQPVVGLWHTLFAQGACAENTG